MSLLQMSASGALLVLAAALARALAGRRMPKGAFLFLWWTAAARLLLPVNLPSQLSIYSFLQAFGQISKAPGAVPAAPAMAGKPVMVFPAVLPAGTALAPASAPAPFPVKTAVWLTGAALLALWFLASYICWGRRFRESLPAECAYAARWQAERPRIQVRVSDRIAAPLAYGILRPMILLPKGMDLTDEAALECILTHEEAHIRRLDGLLKLALAAALCVHWFNPAVWLLYVLANQDMELRCDEVVLGKLGRGSRELYALTLIGMAENGHMPLCGFSRKSGMEERITAIMNFKKKSTLTWVLALLLVACITTVFATNVKTNGNGGADSQDFDQNLKDLDARLLADAAKEAEDSWKEVLEPYVPFGLTYVYAFDGPEDFGNNLKMWFEGQEVRGIYDERTGIWITEHTGNSTYSEDAVELYAVYGENGLSGLRVATDEEQARFTEDREKSSDEGALEQLRQSIRFDNDVCYFTIPEREGDWNIWISGRVLAADGVGMSVHYLEEESEKGEWEPGRTYSFTETSRKVDELIMEASLNDAKATFDLIVDISNLDTDFGVEIPPMLPASKGSEGNTDIAVGLEIVWPADGGEIANSFDERANPGGAGSTAHNGVDIGGLERGAPVYAAMTGVVADTGFDSQAGNYVRLDHGNGLETYYAHCQSIQVKAGDIVDVGQTIATVGSTGASTGPHLHFEILVNGEQQDPAAYYPAVYPAVSDGRGAGAIASWAAQTAAREPLSAEGRKELEKKLVLWAEETLVNGEYPRNKNGQTYAPNQALTSLVGAPPDLIGARATNGKYGYVPLAELSSGTRLLWGTLQRVSDTEAAEPRSLPVYDEEGSVIGEFMIEAGS